MVTGNYAVLYLDGLVEVVRIDSIQTSLSMASCSDSPSTSFEITTYSPIARYQRDAKISNESESSANKYICKYIDDCCKVGSAVASEPLELSDIDDYDEFDDSGISW